MFTRNENVSSTANNVKYVKLIVNYIAKSYNMKLTDVIFAHKLIIYQHRVIVIRS